MRKTPPTPNLADLVSILARVDALFLPDRPPHAAIQKFEAGHRYAVEGIPFHGPSGVQDRKDSQGIRDELAGAGFVRLMRPRSDRSLGVQLTGLGEATARSACGLPGLREMLATMDRMADLKDSPNGFSGHYGTTPVSWVSECELAETDYSKTGDPRERRKLVQIEEALLPALLRGWVIANSDGAGRVWYAQSPRFTAGTPSSIIKPARHRGLPKRSDGMAVVYYTTLKAEQVRLARSGPADPSEIGAIPLPEAPILRRHIEKATA
ncbi:MAG: hypothetical protein ACHRHE_15230 [Tepidisphaerales bacterium]